MEIMDYNVFKQVFNETIFGRSKADLLTKIAEHPSRYIGLFRPTKPKAKILQNLLQSHEIRFGNAFEHIIENYLRIRGCEIHPKRYINNNGKKLDIDQCFEHQGVVYFVEQKVRDDHDSSKIRGQLDNFEEKLGVMQDTYTDKEIRGIFYFIDPDLVKNKNFYTDRLQGMGSDYGAELKLFYGKEFFEYFDYVDIWQEILVYLERWRIEIPDLPEINFDLDAENTFEEIKDLKTSVFRKLFDNEQIFKEILLTLFPEKKTLRLLRDEFVSRNRTIYKTLAQKIEARL